MPGVFISYRRDDAAGYAGRLYDALTAHFGRSLVFIDIDSIRAGQNFVDVIEQRIASCSVVIVLIGRAWLNITDDRAARRLDDPHDFVRLEVESAFRQNVPVIPVLVGSAKMPRQEDLPATLAPLAHLNAIEIFDQLFPDSVKHLVTTLRPLVHPRFVFWPWIDPETNRLRISLLVVALLAVLGIAGFVLSIQRSPKHKDPHEITPFPSEILVAPDSSPSAPVNVTTPSDVAELPSIVEASRDVMIPGSSSQVTGPVKPRILWRANVTVGDAWHIVGIAADGTVYLYDEEREVLDAVSDGREQWAYKVPSPVSFAPDGRLWLGDYCFNSRGQGGRVTRKNLLPDPTTLRIGAPWQQNPYGCRDGKVYALDSRGKQTWAVDLDGNCGSQSPTALPPLGNIYASSDLDTIYAFTRDGRLLWTVKQACGKGLVGVYPLLQDELMVACRDQPLYSLRQGKPLWTSSIGASQMSLSEPVFDGSGNIYIGIEDPSAMTVLAALDKSGSQIWKLSAGGMTMPNPVGFDIQGRLYVAVSDHIVSLSQ